MAKIPILGGFWRFWRPGGKFAPGGKKGEKGPPQNRGRIFPEFPDPDFPTFRTAIGSTPVDEKTEKAKKNNLSRLGELLNTLRKRTKFNDFGGGVQNPTWGRPGPDPKIRPIWRFWQYSTLTPVRGWGRVPGGGRGVRWMGGWHGVTERDTVTRIDQLCSERCVASRCMAGQRGGERDTVTRIDQICSERCVASRCMSGQRRW